LFKYEKMEQTISQLTQLIAKINSVFPDENDLKNFSGISKALIIATLQESNNILTTLKEFDNRVETIIMKRELADLIQSLKKLKILTSIQF